MALHRICAERMFRPVRLALDKWPSAGCVTTEQRKAGRRPSPKKAMGRDLTQVWKEKRFYHPNFGDFPKQKAPESRGLGVLVAHVR